jgi:uncharacterized membrane protein YphA (DoxX/SURF4 family)
MKSTIQQILLYSCKAFIGIVFCISAILKLLSIESFEIYIYSFQLFSLNFSYLVARFIISAELILGIMLILNLLKRYTYIITLSVLTIFTAFLLFVHIIAGNQENCHCFGDIIKLDIVSSVLKNILLIALLLISKNSSLFHLRFEKIIIALLIMAAFVSVNIVSPPDNWISSQKNAELNEKALTEAFSNNILEEELKYETKIICFYGTGCKYCQLMDKKLSLIQKRCPEAEMNFTGVFWGNPENYEKFIQNSGINFTKTYLISPVTFLEITNGKMPVVIIMKDGLITDKFKYNNLQEDIFIKSIKNN